MINSTIQNIRRLLLFSLIGMIMICGGGVQAAVRTSISSGAFGNAAIWSPAGVPDSTDEIIIGTGHIITMNIHAEAASLTIRPGGQLTCTNARKLTLHGALSVLGTLEVTDGDLELLNTVPVVVGDSGILVWDPFDNSETGASLFLNGVEQLHPNSHLIIRKWYAMANVPLGKVVTGHFGNLTVSTLMSGLLFEWDQQNYFEQHPVLGTLTIDQGWIVLDKSGAISNTAIGHIVLQNINSYLDFHSGDHSGLVTITTGSITNIGGVLNGLVNSNADLNLYIAGDFINLGKVALIYNSGVAGKGNGSVKLEVGGEYNQTHGDFRGIFNITTLNSGLSDLEFGSLEVKGGVFIGQYNCHTSGGISKLNVLNDLVVNLPLAGQLFRGTGLSTMSGVTSNAGFVMSVNGEMDIDGSASSEFTTAASGGNETIIVKGKARFGGSKCAFNYGNHATMINFYGDVGIVAGEVHFSKTSGSLMVTVGGDLLVEGGVCNIRSADGAGNLAVWGAYIQSGGEMNLYQSSTINATQTVYATIFGNFSLSGGILRFTNRPLSTVPHRITLSGAIFSLAEPALITQSTVNSENLYGVIHFDREGEIHYSTTGRPLIAHVKQSVSNGCLINVTGGNLYSGTAASAGHAMVQIENGGVIQLNEHQIEHPSTTGTSLIRINDGGRLRITSPQGLYNGTAGAALAATNQLNYFIETEGIVEYTGSNDQWITGSNDPTKQFGTLEINKTSGKVYASATNTRIRQSLRLVDGELDLNGKTLTIGEGNAHAITRQRGYLMNLSETGRIVLVNPCSGTHLIPFGSAPNSYHPVIFRLNSGSFSPLSASTWPTSVANTPLPAGVSHLKYEGTEAGTDRMIDRWYLLETNGTLADIELGYHGTENTVLPGKATGNFMAMQWTGDEWELLPGEGKGVTEGIGTVKISKASLNAITGLIAQNKSEAADLLSFEARLQNRVVHLEWIPERDINADQFIVERSADGINFLPVETIDADHSGNYKTIDQSPMQGISWYRLRQVKAGDDDKLSVKAEIHNQSTINQGITLMLNDPNPFRDHLDLLFELHESAAVEVRLIHSNGRVALSRKINAVEGRNQYRLDDLSAIASGLYILHITNGRSSDQVKVIHY